LERSVFLLQCKWLVLLFALAREGLGIVAEGDSNVQKRFGDTATKNVTVAIGGNTI
jgi:hypothetical protein